ncbi:MAG: hypothetical protein QXK37_03215 [Candidatus Woesearchaeota archaeon]
MKELDKNYLKEHLLQYVKFQLKQGYNIADIKHALLKYGYHKNLIEEVVSLLAPADYPEEKKHEPMNLRQMDKNLYFYLKNMIIDYIMKQQKQGYSINMIRKALIRTGHHPKMVDEAISKIEKGEAVDYQNPKLPKLNPQMLFAALIFLFFTFIVFVSISTNESISIVLYSFAPSAAAIIAVYFLCMVMRGHRMQSLVPFFGVVIAVGVFMASAQMTSFYKSLPGSSVVLVLNVLLSFVLSSIFCFFSKAEEEEILEPKGKRQPKKT